MSLLDVMKKRQEQMSKAPHPLKDDERGARFAYLVGMAMVATVDGSIDPEEENILLNRAIAMNLPEDDGIRAIEAAKTADSETISSVLESLSERRQRVIFMIDLRIMAHADGSLKSEECELWNLFGDMMEINQDDRKALSTFADASLEPDEERASEAIAGIIKHDLDIPISAIKFFLPSTKNISVDNDFFVFLVEKNNLKHIKLALALEAKNNNEIASNVTRANTHGYGETLLHYAARFNTNPEFIKTLIDAGADIKAKTEDEYTPLHFAAALNSNPEIIATLIEAGADIEAKTRYKETPLHVAAELNKNPEIVATLIKAGADIEAKDTFDRNPLHQAARWNKNPEIVATLIKAGADIEAKDTSGETPLHEAAAHNENPEIIATLIKAGADIEAKKTSDETPLHEAAAWNENPEIVATLIKAGADIEAKDTSDETLLHRAAAHNENPEIIAMLIEAGADIEAKNIYKGTPLHVAAAHNENPEIVATLIKAGADIEAKDTFDRNPLHEAARWNENPEIIAMLIEAGADVNAKSYDGKKPLYGAKENENRDKSKTISIINIINKNNNLIKKTRALFTEKNSIPTKTRFKLISINILVAICIGLTIDYIPSFLKGILSLLILSHLAYQVTMINIKYISEKSTTTKRRLASMGIDFILLFFVAIVSDYIPESIETVMAFIISVHFIYQLFAIIIGFFKKKLKK